MNAGVEHARSQSKRLLERALFIAGIATFALSMIAGLVESFEISGAPPFGALTYQRVARRHLAAGDYAGAAAEFRGEQRMNRMHIMPSLNLAGALRKQGDPEAALEALRFGAKQSLDPVIHIQYGRALARRGRLADAQRAMRLAIAVDRSNPRSHLAVGKFYVGLGRLEEAAASYERTLELDSSMTEARYLLGKTRERIEAGPRPPSRGGESAP